MGQKNKPVRTVPILFSTEMVQSLLRGQKTVTRRLVKPQSFGKPKKMPDSSCWPGYFEVPGTSHVIMPPYLIGDILYVRETWNRVKLASESEWHYEYRASCENPLYFSNGFFAEWRPSIHMPREAARIFLRVTDVKVERLQDITEEQARAEGAMPFCLSVDSEDTPDSERTWHEVGPALPDFIRIWNSNIKHTEEDKYGWSANPWVWVIAFERVSKDEADFCK